MHLKILFTTLVLTMVTLALRSEDAYPGDQPFIKQAAIHGMFEVKAGKLAFENAFSPDVRAFGLLMLNDHKKLNEQLELIAKNKRWNLPVNLDEIHQAKLDQFTELKPADLDREYSAEMAKEHKLEKEHFKNAAKYAADPDLRTWAEAVEKVIDDHLANVPILKKVIIEKTVTITKE